MSCLLIKVLYDRSEVLTPSLDAHRRVLKVFILIHKKLRPSVNWRVFFCCVVQLMSKTTTFKGFLVQALDANDIPIGFFTVPEGNSMAKATDCPNNQTMVHIAQELFSFFNHFLIDFVFLGLCDPHQQQRQVQSRFPVVSSTWLQRLTLILKRIPFKWEELIFFFFFIPGPVTFT